jgi:hypothetical protein
LRREHRPCDAKTTEKHRRPAASGTLCRDWCCVTLFPHVHRIDGCVYVHSHPYSGTSGNPAHSHTAQQFQLIAHLSLLVLAVGALVAFVRALIGRIFRFRLRRPAVRQGAPMRSFALRAPPVC